MTARVPKDALADHVLAAEAFYNTVSASNGEINMSDVRFVRPYGVVALVCAAHHHYHTTGSPLRLIGLQKRVHQYLERVDLFKHAAHVITVPATLDDLFDRTQPNPKLLELTPVHSTADMLGVITQAERIFSYWLQVRNLRRLMSVLSEICANVYQHSGTGGVVMIQTHEARSVDQVRVRVAIGDVGMGVRAALHNRFGPLSEDTLGYLQEAMNGRTSRSTGRGGLGLRVVQQAVEESGGSLFLRSDDAAILSEGSGSAVGYTALTPIPGTQLAVDFHAPLRHTHP